MKVGMERSFVNMGQENNLLIQKLKSIIQNQLLSKQKREQLLKAITNNVKYMSILNDHVQEELNGTKRTLQRTVEQNEQLASENYDLTELNARLEKDQLTLGEKKEEIVKLDGDNKKKKDHIDKLQANIDDQTDRMEKINLELTIVSAEKMAMKKELDALTIDHRRLGRDFKQQRNDMEALTDECNKIRKQNGEYRGLILENEKKFQAVGGEIQDLQKHIERKNATINRANNEAATYKKQIEKLLEALKEKSDSESFDDEKEKLLNVKKAREADMLKEEIKNL